MFLTACASRIDIETDVAEVHDVTVRAFAPLIDASGKDMSYPGRCVLQRRGTTQNGRLSLPRNEGYDLLIARFSVESDGEQAGGVRYVNDFGADFCPPRPMDPPPAKPIGTWCNASDEDVEAMGFGCMMDELDQAWLMAGEPKADDIIHMWNGKAWRFNRAMVEEHDRWLGALAKKGIPTLLRFINRFKYHNRACDSGLFDVICHPGYESDFSGVEMSAVNLRTEEGLEHYCACLDFLFSRYAAYQSPYGLSHMMDVGNEVNSQRIWHNAGPMTCDAFMEEYAVALRLAWQLSRQYDPGYRVNISLEQNFTKPFIDDPLRYYPAKTCLERLAAITRRDGDFDWGVAAHPYPENLAYPDFYNDRTPTFSLETPIITMNQRLWHSP